MKLSTRGEKVFVDGTLQPLAKALEPFKDVTEVYHRTIDFDDYNLALRYNLEHYIEELTIHRHYQVEWRWGFRDEVQPITLSVQF